YRPFFKQHLYFDRDFIVRPGYNDSFFPLENKNKAIGITGLGGNKGFSTFIVESALDFQTLMNGLVFPLYYYEEKEETTQPGLFEEESKERYIRRDGVSDFILN